MMTQQPFQDKNIILVEGVSDVCFIKGLLKKYGIDNNILVTNRDNTAPRENAYDVALEYSEQHGGKGNLAKAFRETLKSLRTLLATNKTNIKTQSIIVLLDGDGDSVNKNLKAFIKALKENDKNKENALFPGLASEDISNKTIQHSSNISFGCYILKDFVGEDFQDLETMLLKLCTNNDLAVLIDDHIKRSQNKDLCKPNHPKRQLSLLLSSLNEYEGNQNVLLMNYLDTYFDLDTDKYASLKNLVSKLKEITRKDDNDNDTPTNEN
jgi:hypothetical protein